MVDEATPLIPMIGDLFHMVTAFRVGPGGAHFKNVSIIGADIGIQGAGNIVAENLSFRNVRKPFDMGGGTAHVSGTRISDDPKLRPSLNKSFSGWTRPKGPPLPAFCPNCESVFASRNYNFESSYFYSRDNEEVCPLCGNEHAKLSDGLFDLSRDIVEVFDAPEMTHAMLAELSGISRQMFSGAITVPEAFNRFKAVNPKIDSFVSKAAKISGCAAAFVTCVTGLASIYYLDQQTKLLRDQVSIEREQRISTEEVLRKTLQTLSEITFVLRHPSEEPNKKADKEPSRRPPENKTAQEASLSELAPNQKPID